MDYRKTTDVSSPRKSSDLESLLTLRRAIDLTMLAVHNSQERSLSQLIELVKEADPRLHYVRFQQPQGSNRAFIEILFDE